MEMATYTREEFDEQLELAEKWASWELEGVIRALGVLRLLNGSREEARLAAARRVRNERRKRKKRVDMKRLR